MYCVKCGRLAREGEKRCLECGMRLVSPAKLNRLLDEDRDRRNGVRPAKAVPKQKKAPALSGAAAFLVKAKHTAAVIIAAIGEYVGEKIPVIKKEFAFRFKKVRRWFRKLKRKTLTWLSGIRLPELPKLRLKTPEKKKNVIKRKKKRRQSFTERNLRTIVAMSLIALALLVFVIWGTLSAPGQRTFASIGMGSARGYILLGDDYMNGANYTRAVESYYTALNKNGSYESAFKLARAYSYTGDMDKCVSALLYCTEHYPAYKEPYVQLIAIYPNKNTRPDVIRKAIAQGNAQFGLEQE